VSAISLRRRKGLPIDRPAIHCRVSQTMASVPEGRLKWAVRMARRSFFARRLGAGPAFRRPSGTRTVFLFKPAMNCRPTIGNPFRRRKAYGGHGRDKDRIGSTQSLSSCHSLIGHIGPIPICLTHLSEKSEMIQPVLKLHVDGHRRILAQEKDQLHQACPNRDLARMGRLIIHDPFTILSRMIHNKDVFV
jgi:hypothetical protein